MDAEEVKDSVKNFVDSRLRNPYFGSVIAVWLITNRVLIFGLFNFDPELSLEQRIAWAHQQLQSFTLLSFLKLHGFFATIIWSLFLGYIVMIVYNKINAVGKILYIWVNRGTINLVQKFEPSKWIGREQYGELARSVSLTEDELNKKRIEITGVQREYENVRSQYLKSEEEKKEKEKLIHTNLETMKLHEAHIKQFTDEKNRFKIIYARYGKYEKFVEVTKIVSDLILSKGNFIVENSTMGIDPHRFKIKELFIEYEYENKIEKFLANEDETVELKENKLFAKPSVTSIQKILWLTNQTEIANIFKDEWTLSYSKNNEKESESVRIDTMGNYFADGKRSFDIQVRELDSKKINLRKIGLNGELHSDEVLDRINDKLIKGKDSLDYTLEYTKK